MRNSCAGVFLVLIMAGVLGKSLDPHPRYDARPRKIPRWITSPRRLMRIETPSMAA